MTSTWRDSRPTTSELQGSSTLQQMLLLQKENLKIALNNF